MSEVLYKYQSLRWDMDITLEELLESNEECKVDRNYKAHKYDDCYHGYCMYLKHPNNDGDSEVMIGIFEDGFTYLGDSGKTDFPLEKTEPVVVEMYFYGEWVKKKEDNKYKLLSEKNIDYDNM